MKEAPAGQGEGSNTQTRGTSQMVRASRVPVDVVSIAEGLRSFADLVVKYPAEDAGQLYPETEPHFHITAGSVGAVHDWARILDTPVVVQEWEPDVHTRADAVVGGLRVSVTYIERTPRVLRRPSNVIEPCEGIEP